MSTKKKEMIKDGKRTTIVKEAAMTSLMNR